MKIRDFLKGVDPEACKPASWFKITKYGETMLPSSMMSDNSEHDYAPVCPLAHAGVNHGFEPNKSRGSGMLLRTFAAELGISSQVFSTFFVSYDNDESRTHSPTDRFNHALCTAEEKEKAINEAPGVPKGC